MIFGLTNLMKPIDPSRCIEKLFHLNYILLVLSKGEILLSPLLEYRNCLYGVDVSVLQQMYALTELNLWLWIGASVKALTYSFLRRISFRCAKIVPLLLIILVVASINSISANRSRLSFAELMDSLSCYWQNSIVICVVYLLRSNLMIITLLRRRSLMSSTLYGLSAIWVSLVSLFF